MSRWKLESEEYGRPGEIEMFAGGIQDESNQKEMDESVAPAHKPRMRTAPMWQCIVLCAPRFECDSAAHR